MESTPHLEEVMIDPKKWCCPGEGPSEAKICFIGEAPGFHEARIGRPFYERAQAGSKLRDVMHLVGLSRSEVYITNVLKEHPPNDDITPWFKIMQGGRVVVSEDYLAYVELLKAELMERKNIVNVFVPLGNTALYALTGQTYIMKRRGSILEGKFWPGMKVVPSVHPSAIAGSEYSKRGEYIYIHYLRMDLKRAIEESKSPEIILPQRKLHINPSYNDVIKYLTECFALDRVAFDIEVSSTSEEISCISFAKSPLDAMSINFSSYGDDVFTPDQEANIWLLIEKILSNKRIAKTGQNIVFDSSLIYHRYGIKTNNMDDTMIAMGITFPDFPKGLDFQTAMFTREPYYKDEGKKWSKIGDESAFYIYNAKDSAVTSEIFPKVYADCVRQGNEKTYERQKALIPILTFMQEFGMRADVEGMKRASVDAVDKVAELTAKLHKLCGFDINPASPKQLMDYFYTTKGLTPYLKGSKPTIDLSALTRLARSGVEEATILKQIRKLSKMKGTYFDMKVSSDGRIRSSMNPVGAETGRLSSSQDIFGEGGNIQNLPEQFRRFILVDEGMVMYQIDLNQAENRIVAYCAPEPVMIKTFESGIDVHRQTASLCFGIPFNEVSDEEGSSPLGNGEHSQRFWGKKANHEFNYDRGYKTFALEFELPEKEGKFIHDRYHQVYPGVRQYHAWIKSRLTKDRTIENPFGRKRLFLGRWGDELFKEAYAQFPQSTVADKINEQGLEFIYYNQQWFGKVYILNQIHDSIVIEIPVDAGWTYHAECLLRIVESLETPITWRGTTFTIPADVIMGLNLNKYDGKGVVTRGKNAGELAGQLSNLYQQLRECSELPNMDSSISNSSLHEEKVSPPVGDDRCLS